MNNKFSAGSVVVATDIELLNAVCIIGPMSLALLKPFTVESAEDPEPNQTSNPYDAGTVYDDQGFAIPSKALKQVAYYNPDAYFDIPVGGSATVCAIRHPLLGSRLVHTSLVLKHDETTGVFETRNTVYYPKAAA